MGTKGVTFIFLVVVVPLVYSIAAAAFSDQQFTFAYFFSLTIATGAYTLDRIRYQYPYFPLSDIGFIYVGTILLYLLVPTLKFIVSGYEWGIFSDARLQLLNPNQSDLVPLLLNFNVYTIAFGATYIYFLKRAKIPIYPLIASRVNATHLFILLLLLFVTRFLFANAIGASGEYGEKVTSVSTLPLLVRQIYFFVQSFVFGVGFITITVASFQYQKHKLVFWLVLGMFVIPPIATLGSRHEAFTFILLATVLYNSFVRTIPTLKIAFGGIILLSGMLILGFVRSYTDGGSIFLAANEFEAMFATFYEILASPPPSPPLAVYFSDFLALFPQQLLPFDKLDPGTWYMKQYFPEIADENPEIGFGFGVISEAAIGLGVLELALRGALLGFLFASLSNRFNGRNRNLLYAFIYLFCVVTVFRTFRASSFELIRSVVFNIVPAIIIYKLLPMGRRRIAAADSPTP